MKIGTDNKENLLLGLVAGLFLLELYIFINTAWVSEDAFITFRTVDNFINGRGLVWNIGERVQAYTHPLWMLILSVGYFFTREIFYTSIAISGVCFIVTVAILLTKFTDKLIIQLIVLVCLIGSRSFNDFSTSGLENPLLHLLLVGFLHVYLNLQKSYYYLLSLSLITALIGMTRLDALLLVLPVMSYVVLKNLPKVQVRQVVIGLLPLILWELFSLFYYGSLFPNTAFAKITGDIPSSIIWLQGWRYIWYSVIHDPVTMGIISLAIILGIKERKFLITGGVLLYQIYMVSLGGDFMGGRFFSAVFVIALVILILGWEKFSRRQLIYVGVVILMLQVFTVRHPLKNGYAYVNRDFYHGIADERGFYYPTHGLLRAARDKGIPDYREVTETARVGQFVEIHSNVGSVGFNVGPGIYIVDKLALTDPLLARLPPKADQIFRPGHLERAMPTGYIASLETGENRIVDENLAQFYDSLTIVLQDPLFYQSRIKTLIYFLIGEYNYLLETYADSDATLHSEKS